MAAGRTPTLCLQVKCQQDGALQGPPCATCLDCRLPCQWLSWQQAPGSSWGLLVAWSASRCHASTPCPSRQMNQSHAHLEEGIWLVSCLLEGLVQRKVTTLVFLYVSAHVRQQDQGQEALCLHAPNGGSVQMRQRLVL